MVYAPWDWVPGAEELGMAEMLFTVERGVEGGWFMDYRYEFSPDDRMGVDLEGWGEEEADEDGMVETR